MLNPQELGQFISEKRKLAGMTQEVFASELGITPQAVSKWETGVSQT
ncbi:MAG: helix-turn-helix transcriptional regulator [Clostridiales bacterium]|nr:helix-turn-helix transcriptional regulator [Clostridiales bacterium]